MAAAERIRPPLLNEERRNSIANRIFVKPVSEPSLNEKEQEALSAMLHSVALQKALRLALAQANNGPQYIATLNFTNPEQVATAIRIQGIMEGAAGLVDNLLKLASVNVSEEQE